MDLSVKIVNVYKSSPHGRVGGPDSPYTQISSYPLIFDSDTHSNSSPWIEPVDGSNSQYYPQFDKLFYHHRASPLTPYPASGSFRNLQLMMGGQQGARASISSSGHDYEAASHNAMRRSRVDPSNMYGSSGYVPKFERTMVGGSAKVPTQRSATEPESSTPVCRDRCQVPQYSQVELGYRRASQTSHTDDDDAFHTPQQAVQTNQPPGGPSSNNSNLPSYTRSFQITPRLYRDLQSLYINHSQPPEVRYLANIQLKNAIDKYWTKNPLRIEGV